MTSPDIMAGSAYLIETATFVFRPASKPLSHGCSQLESLMQVLILAVAWCLLLAVAWPLALLVLVLFLCLLSIPFRILGVVLEAAIAFIKTLLFLPARLLGHRS